MILVGSEVEDISRYSQASLEWQMVHAVLHNIISEWYCLGCA